MKRVILLIICLLLSVWPVMAAETEQAGRSDMKITWIGHACFKIESNGYTLILDPYEDGYVPGLKPLRESANMVLCSHEHGDHNAKDLIEITEGQSSPFTITTIDTFHDEVQGAKRGPDTIHIIDDGSFRIAHLGDLGCELEKEQIEQLKNLDVCLIPVGGHYTIDGTSGISFVEKPPYYGCPSGRIGLLSSMFTDPSYRRRGIAKELLTKVVDEARAYGCGTVQITASDMGVLLYTDFGFVKNGNFMQYRL